MSAPARRHPEITDAPAAHPPRTPLPPVAGRAKPRPDRNVIIYSSIRHGHISATHMIALEITRQNPHAVVRLQAIRAFMSSIRRRIDERLSVGGHSLKWNA